MCYDGVHRQRSLVSVDCRSCPEARQRLRGFPLYGPTVQARGARTYSAIPFHLSRPTRCGTVSKTPWLQRQQSDSAPVMPGCKDVPGLELVPDLERVRGARPPLTKRQPPPPQAGPPPLAVSYAGGSIDYQAGRVHRKSKAVFRGGVRSEASGWRLAAARLWR